MIVASGAIYLIAGKGREVNSSWVSRLKSLSGKLSNVNPIILGIGFVALIFAELGVILLLMKFSPFAVKALYIFSTANIAFVVISIWFDRPNQKVTWTIVKIFLSCAVGFSWILFPEWFVYNLVGFVCAIGFLQLFPSLKFKSALALGLAIIIYDIVGVYGTGWIILLVKGLTFVPPAVIYIPAALKAATTGMSMIGLGDIIIGGIMLLMAKRYGVVVPAFCGYTLGVTASYVLAVLTSYAAPATMFIVPVMLLTVWLSAKHNQNPAWLAGN